MMGRLRPPRLRFASRGVEGSRSAPGPHLLRGRRPHLRAPVPRGPHRRRRPLGEGPRDASRDQPLATGRLRQPRGTARARRGRLRPTTSSIPPCGPRTWPSSKQPWPTTRCRRSPALPRRCPNSRARGNGRRAQGGETSPRLGDVVTAGARGTDRQDEPGDHAPSGSPHHIVQRSQRHQHIGEPRPV